MNSLRFRKERTSTRRKLFLCLSTLVLLPKNQSTVGDEFHLFVWFLERLN